MPALPLEIVFEYLFLAGVALLVIGCLWMVIAAFLTHWKWGLAVGLFPPLSIWFSAKNPRRGLPPLAMILLGVIGMSLPAIITRTRVDLGPYESVVNGERHLTLTGWDRKDYSFLKNESNIVVLQMANADVTDETLQLLSGLQNLKELDVSESQITDSGLAELAKLPNLETLRVANTKVTDVGFKHLATHPKLSRIDATGTALTQDFIDWSGSNTNLMIMN